ncbi:MFS transporter [Lysinibacillus yapensis]|uniref:MFS transporter n=1 Tax=Ureibacillus yapensis TaxID=2304605 RepID=A0A396SE47_9BACL|nr:MFS transporter [Lysinibacillus yapensis]RHW38246.1 MFS transporter [Lysinibacillus yapensis]
MTEEFKRKRATYHLYTFLFSKMISSLGANVYAFGMSMYILSITGSALSFAANLIFSIVPRMIFSPIAGIVSDRLPKKKIVLIGQGISIFSITGLLLISFSSALSIGAIYATTFFYTIGSTFSTLAFSASIANLVDQERIQRAMSFNQLSISLSGIGGPVIGGMLFGFVSMESFILINVVLYGIAFLLDASMDFDLYSSKTINSIKVESMIQSLQKGMDYIRSKPALSRLLLVVLWLNFFFSAVTVGTNYIFVERLKIEYTSIGFIEAAGAIGMLFSSIYLAVISTIQFPLLFSKRAILGLSILVSGMSLPLFFKFSSLFIFLYYSVVMFLFGSLSVFTNTPIGVMLQKDVEESYRGRILGLIEMMAMGFMPIGSLFFGLLYDLVAAQIVLLICSILLIVITLILLPSSFIRAIYPQNKQKSLPNSAQLEMKR